MVFGGGLLLQNHAWRVRLCVVAALAELVVFGYGFAPAIRIQDVPKAPAALLKVRASGHERDWFVAGPLDAFPDNLGTLYGVRQLASYDVLTSEADMRRLVAAGYDPFFHGFRTPLTPDEVRLLGRMGVRWWIDQDAIEIAGASRPAPARSNPPEFFGLGLLVSSLGFALFAVLLATTRIANPAPTLKHIGDTSAE
jgi:hypothetical protein